MIGVWQAGKPVSVGSGSAIDTATWVLDRLPRMGVPIPPEGRLQRALRLIARVHERELILTPDSPGLLGRVADAQRTVSEFYIIVRAISNRPRILTSLLRDKLLLMLGGNESEHQDNNTIHRNTQFELFVLAQFLMGGADVRIAEPDLRFTYGVEDVGIAAKRLSSRKKLVKRVMEGALQIESGNGNGFVAVNLDRFVTDVGGPRTSEDIAQRGLSYSMRIAALHGLVDRFANRPAILGFLNFGYTYHWEFDGSIPRMSAAFFRQAIRLSTAPQDVELAGLFFGGLSARIDNALRAL